MKNRLTLLVLIGAALLVGWTQISRAQAEQHDDAHWVIPGYVDWIVPERIGGSVHGRTACGDCHGRTEVRIYLDSTFPQTSALFLTQRAFSFAIQPQTIKKGREHKLTAFCKDPGK